MPRPVRSRPHAILQCILDLCTVAVAAIAVFGPPAWARLTDGRWSLAERLEQAMDALRCPAPETPVAVL